jgi:membrane associated rhomboid family serine protease
VNALAIQRIGPIPNLAKLGEYSLVLRSQEIAHGVSSRPDGFYFTVQDRDVLRSVDALRAYEEENRDFRPVPRAREKLPFERTLAAPVVMIALALFFLVTGPVALHSGWFSVGTAGAARILHGEAWRAVTALTLHADLSHVLGNVIAGGIFLGLLFRRLGPGRGLFLTLVAGTLANFANAGIHAWMHQPHRSIGASTAVFAAVGLLAASQIAIDFRAGIRRWTDRVGPIVGGLALLGLLGSSAQSDLWAHLLGLVAGAVVGLAVLLPAKGRLPVGPRGQLALGALSILAIVASWTVAFVVHPMAW